MIDSLAILISCCGALFVAYRAVLLNTRLPWFKPTTGETGQAPASRHPRTDRRAGRR